MRTFKYVSRVAGAAVLGVLTGHCASAQAVSLLIEVTKTRQQTFQGFGASISNTVGDFLPSGGRADKPGSTAKAIYNLLLSPNSPKQPQSHLPADEPECRPVSAVGGRLL